MNIPFYTYQECARKLSWSAAVDALRKGHRLPKAQIGDLFMGPASATLLNRAAYIDGLGYGVKAVTVFGENPRRGLPTVQGAMMVFDPSTGSLVAMIENPLVTTYKTAADSVLGAQLLARENSEQLLIVGGGAVAQSLISAYGAAFPGLKRISVWARRAEQAEALIESVNLDSIDIAVTTDLPEAVADADIIATATMAREPVLHGAWVRPGAHIDLIGAFKADMREADDDLMRSGSLFVDSRETTLGHIGELMIPMKAGIFDASHIRADLYELVQGGHPGRRSDQEITVFKNGGGAHLDLMMARYIASACA